MATVTGLSVENLHKIKKEREILRKMFTRSCNELEIELITHPIKKDNIVGRLAQIEDKGSRLFVLDDQIRMLTIEEDDDEEMKREYESVEKFREYLIMCRSKCEFALVNQKTQYGASSETGASNVKRHFKLPKIELKKFDGDVRNWIGFWGQFRKIHEDDELDVEDKFQYLLQSMVPGSVAEALVDSFPPSASNYEKAIIQLKTRFARDEFLIEVYVRELLNLVLKQASSNKTGMSLASLFDKLETQLRALESLGVTSEKYAAMLYPLAESALPEEILRAWERLRSNLNIKDFRTAEEDKSINYLNYLLDFLRSEVESEERISLAKTSFANGKESKHYCSRSRSSTEKYKHGESDTGNLYTAATIFSAENTGKKVNICIFCDGKSHSSQNCIKARAISIAERKEIVSKKKACFGCLKYNHTIKKCKAFIRCIICGRRHFPILCGDLAISQSKETKVPDIARCREPQNLENVMSSNNITGTLLQTVLVKLVSKSGTKIVRALLDSASQRSYILSDCAKKMKLKKVRDETIVQSVFGGKQSEPETHSLFDVTIEDLNSSVQFKLLTLEQNKLCSYVPRLENVDILNLLKQKNIIIYDNKKEINKISLLLGADIYGKLLTGRVETIDNLVAIETYLGWTLIGSFHLKNSIETLCCFDDITLSDLWSLDVLGIKDQYSVKKREILEAEAVKHFNETITFNDENRYEIKLPWIEGHPTISNNKDIAKSRLLTTTKRLINLGKYNDYNETFIEWERLGIIEEITSTSKDGKEHYIPHHPVVKETSTTKIRPVFDASALDEKGVSLNSCLMKGPNLIELIPNIFIKFRIGMIGIISDIKKAFLQINIALEDRDVLRFLWWENLSLKRLKIYRHTRVVFGVSSSPFLLAATLSYHLERAPENLRETSQKLLNSFYVDNCVTSVNNRKELSKFIKESKNLMKSAGFDLRGWVYNSPRLFPENEKELPTKGNKVSVLGLQWDFENDTLCCDVQVLNEVVKVPTTKRGLLSAAQRIFDPIGFTCPVILIPKLLLQETWKLKINWDTKLPDEIIENFGKWLQQIHLLKLCSIPRAIFRNTSSKNVSLHIFCDASKLAYAACVFIRIEANELTYSRLLQAKSRISPIKNVTLPRLELLAAVIGCRLYQFMTRVDYFRTLETYFWSDSKVVLTWIKTKSCWTTFVMNRVNEIRNYSKVNDWHHVPGDMNAADLPSRGCSCKRLLETKWWEGPEWLNKEKQFWPSLSQEFLEKNAMEESTKITFSNQVTQENIISVRFNYFSKYSRIIRMIAWMIRFSEKCRGRKIGVGELTYGEVAEAEIRLMKIIQDESFGGTSLKEIYNVNMFKDENNLIRVRTKLLFAEDTHSFKFPIILPYRHIIVFKLIKEQHNNSCHAGVQVTLRILRERFWIIKARKMVREVISKCVICKRFKAKALQTPFAPLPNDRTKISATFEISGTDFAGPLYLKGGDRAWIVIFTCATYRACHLELVKSLSTDAFLQALRRFIARRGRVSVIYSDNGTNFVASNNQLKCLNWNEILKYSSVHRIKWKFNVPTAPWWGGWWERIVRMVKELLRRNLGKKTLDYEELMTILCDCEALINSRPLTYVTDDAEELVPISPSSFLQSIQTSEVPDLDELNRTNMKKRLRYLQKIRENLRERFRNEYLANLVHYGHRKSDKLSIGDIVLVGSDNKKRTDWPIGKILEIYPGRDSIARVARIKVPTGEILRPFQRIYPLEINANEELNILQGKLRTDRCIMDHIETSREKQSNEGTTNEEKKTETITPKTKENDKTAVLTRSRRLVRVPDRYGF